MKGWGVSMPTSTSTPLRSSPAQIGGTRSFPISIDSPLPTPRTSTHGLADGQKNPDHVSSPRKRRFSSKKKNELVRGGGGGVGDGDSASTSSQGYRRSRIILDKQGGGGDGGSQSPSPRVVRFAPEASAAGPRAGAGDRANTSSSRRQNGGVEADRAAAANAAIKVSLASLGVPRHHGRRHERRNAQRRGKRERIDLLGPLDSNTQKNDWKMSGEGDIVVLDDDSDDGGGKLGPVGGPIEVLELSDDDGSNFSEVDLTDTAAAGPRVASWRERCSFGHSNDDGVVIVSDGQSAVAAVASSSQSSSSSLSSRKRRRDESVSASAAAALSIRDANEHASKELDEPKGTPFSRILDFFPDLDPSYAERMLRNAGIRDDAVREPVPMPHGTDLRLEGQIQSVVARLLDGGAQSYPKRRHADDKNSVGTNKASFTGSENRRFIEAVDVVSRPKEVRRPYLHDYTSTSSFEPTEKYKVQSLQRLAAAIPFLSVKGIDLLLAKCNGRYSFVYKLVCDAVLGLGEKVKTGGDANDLSEEEVRRLGRRHKRLELLLKGDSSLLPDEVARLNVDGRPTTLRRPRRGKNVVPPISSADTDEVLTDEVRYASDMLADRSAEVQARADRLRARRASQKTGSVFECGCCFSDDLAFEEMVSCRNEGHLFCVDCVRRHAEERVFGLGSLEEGGKGEQGTKVVASVAELRCMHADCGSGFPRELLKKALPAKVMKKYEELQAKAALGNAAVEDLCTCPKCDFQAVLPATERIFHCPVEGCRYESCRECGEPPHIPLRCEEVEKKNETEGRRTVEEAMTEARVRTCPRYPKCKNRFYKTDGCNKMTCPPPCGAFVCYVCRQEIQRDVGYAHFCQTPHCTHERCKKCPLYSNAKEDDLRAAKEAGLKAAEEVRRKSHAENGEVTGNGPSSSRSGNKDINGSGEVNVDVDALLRDPEQSRRQGPGNVAPAVAPPRHVARAHPRAMVQQPRMRVPPAMHPHHPHIARPALPALAVAHPQHLIPYAIALPLPPGGMDQEIHARLVAQAQRIRQMEQRVQGRHQGRRHH